MLAVRKISYRFLTWLVFLSRSCAAGCARAQENNSKRRPDGLLSLHNSSPVQPKLFFNLARDAYACCRYRPPCHIYQAALIPPLRCTVERPLRQPKEIWAQCHWVALTGKADIQPIAATKYSALSFDFDPMLLDTFGGCSELA